MSKSSVIFGVLVVLLIGAGGGCKRTAQQAAEPKAETAALVAVEQAGAQGAAVEAEQHFEGDGHDHAHDHDVAPIAAPADVAAPPAEALRTPSGLAYKVLKSGGADPAMPRVSDSVKVHYTGWTTDGKMFDSSVQRGEPAVFGLSQVIEGWTEGLQLMKVGDSVRFWIPESLAYKGRAGAPAGMLVFDVELLEVIRAPERPADLVAPGDAVKLPSGIAYKVIGPNAGGQSIAPDDVVRFDFAGWTHEGELFDASMKRGEPMVGPVNIFFPAWKEVLPHLKAGEKALIWVPESLAFGGAQGAPAGDVVFELDVKSAVVMPKTPEDVGAAPEGATKESNGVAWRVLKAGSGTQHPLATSKVVFHYTGWTADGQVFDSSLWRDKPYEGQLSELIAGWAQVLPLMVAGESRRVWLPEGTASKGEARLPGGMLVFDLELLEIK